MINNKIISLLYIFLLATSALIVNSCSPDNTSAVIQPAKEVIHRAIGERVKEIEFKVIEAEGGLETYEIEAKNGRLTIGGSSTVAICYAFNTYLKEGCGSMKTWSGEHMQLPLSWPDFDKRKVTTPYKFRYYLNVVTFGYTTPYWDWARWEKELDWMALHEIGRASCRERV